MAHTPELTSTILLSGTVTICYRIHIFVKDAVACFQLDFNTYFHAPFAFFVSCCLALMLWDFTSLFACSCCFMWEFVWYFQLVHGDGWHWTLLISAFWQTYLTHAHAHCMNLAKVWLSSFIANSSPVLIKKLPQPWTSCWGNKEVIMFINGLQLRVISPPIFKLFAFLSLCSSWVEQALCFAKTTSRQVRQTADAFFWKTEWSAFLCTPFSVYPHLLSLEVGNTVNSIPPLSPSLVFVSQCTQLLSPSLPYTHKSKASTGWSESKFSCS